MILFNKFDGLGGNGVDGMIIKWELLHFTSIMYVIKN